ncbi:MAG: transporter [bacterium]
MLLLSLIPIGATAIGAAAAAIRPPGPGIRSGIQHFAAGVVFSVVAVELLPDVVRGQSVVSVTVGFVCGIGIMLLLRHLTAAAEGDGPDEAGDGTPRAIQDQIARATARSLPIGMLAAIGVDILLDGILLGIAFAAGTKEGVLLTVALSLELLSLGLATSTSLIDRGASRIRSVVIATGLSLSLAIGAVAGDTVLHNAPAAVLAGVLSFGCAALLFLVTEELLVEAHEVPETPAATAMFFAGFLLFLILGMLG